MKAMVSGARARARALPWLYLLVNACLVRVPVLVVGVSGLSSQPYNNERWPVRSPQTARPNERQQGQTNSGPQQDLRLVSKKKAKRSSSSTSTDSRQQQRRPPAPRVDSTLLRFVSSQRETVLVDTIQQPPPRPRPPSQQQQEPDVIVQQSSQSQPGQQSMSSSSPSWLGQYNCHLVTQSLLSLSGSAGSNNGVSEALAVQAGNAVQKHVLGRMARRRLRIFLKTRDVLWDQTTTTTTTIPSATDAINARNDASTRIATSTSTMDDAPLLLTSSSATTTTSNGNSVQESFSFANQHSDMNHVLQLLQDKGLSGTDICTILSHTPSVALMRPSATTATTSSSDDVTMTADADKERNEATLEATVTRAFQGVLLESLRLRKYDARKVLRNCPGLLTVRGSKNAQQIVTLLASCGVSKTSLARDKTALPVLLSRSPAAIFRLVAFLSSDAVRMNVQAIGPLLRRPESATLLNAVAPIPRLQMEADQALVGANDAVGDESEQKDATALWFGGRSSKEQREQVNKTYRQMSATAWTLRHELGTQDLGKVIAAYPSVLLLDAETQILSTASYLMNDLGIWQDDLPRVLQLYPALLGMDVHDMKRVVSYLLSLDVAEESLAIMFRAFPSLFMLDIERDMKPVVSFLRDIGIVNIGRFITRLPPVLGYSVEDELVPKWEYLCKVTTQGSFVLSAFPAYFSYPLDRRIKARYQYLQRVKRVPTQLLSLDLVLRYGDRDFATRIARDTDNGAAFLEFLKSQTNTAGGARRKRSAARAKQPTARRS